MCTPRYEFYGKKCGEVFFATSVIVVQLVVAGSRCQLAVLLCCWQLRTRLNYVVDHCWSCVLSLIACDLAPLRCVVMMFFLLFLMTHIVRLLLHREPRPAKQPLGLISRIVVCQWVHDRCLSIFEHSSMQRLVLLRCQHLVYNFLASSLETPWVVLQRSLLTAADLMKQTSDLTQMQTKAWSKQSTP